MHGICSRIVSQIHICFSSWHRRIIEKQEEKQAAADQKKKRQFNFHNFWKYLNQLWFIWEQYKFNNNPTQMLSTIKNYKNKTEKIFANEPTQKYWDIFPMPPYNTHSPSSSLLGPEPIFFLCFFLFLLKFGFKSN